MKTPEQILKDCKDIMPFDLKSCFDPYIIECMKIYAKEHNKISDMFSFANYLRESYDYHDNTEEGDIYIHKDNKLKYTEEKIYKTWLVVKDIKI